MGKTYEKLDKAIFIYHTINLTDSGQYVSAIHIVFGSYVNVNLI